jgi:predicted dehydrogenase
MLGIGVIGCGYWGPNVIRNFASIEACELRAVCDLDPERLSSVHRRYPAARATADAHALIADPAVDAVAICTPIHTHFQLASAALEAGKHVLVEKPLTDSVETAEALVEMADHRGLTLQVDHTFVYGGAVRKIREIIDAGELGDLLYFDSVRVNLGLFQSEVNVLWDLAPHDLSIMTHLIDRQPIWVSAVGSTHYGKHENLAYITMKFDDTLIAHLHVNWLAPVKLRSTLIGGSRRMIVYDDLAPSEKVLVYDKGITRDADASSRTRALVDYRVGDMHAPHLDNAEPLNRVCRAFIDAVERGIHPPTDGLAGLRVVRLLEAGQQSLRKNGERIAL